MRLEGQKKMGFYPTPSSVTEQIRNMLAFPEGKVSLFDPCCGLGEVLHGLAQDANAETYGIELDHARANTAKKALNHCFQGDIFAAKVSCNAFSLMLNNPPYDTDGEERKELTFLRGTVKYLQPHGVIVYIIPQHRLDEKIAKLLAWHFEDIQVFRFPTEDYGRFSQIVIFGARKERAGSDAAAFRGLVAARSADLPEIPANPDWLYAVPETKPIALFKSGSIDEDELQKSLQRSPLWDRITHKVQIAKGSNHPPLPLRTGHLALVLASGYLDGEVGDASNLHIVKGRVFKKTKRTTEKSGEDTVVKETDIIRVSVKILEPSGEIKILM